jgi:hypothetical protein
MQKMKWFFSLYENIYHSVRCILGYSYSKTTF